MTDRELLEAAYKAYRPGENYVRLVNDAGRDYWNPLTDDGDALRLAVRLNIAAGNPGMRLSIDWQTGDDPYAATRRAIVRAAAAINKEV